MNMFGEAEDESADKDQLPTVEDRTAGNAQQQVYYRYFIGLMTGLCFFFWHRLHTVSLMCQQFPEACGFMNYVRLSVGQVLFALFTVCRVRPRSIHQIMTLSRKHHDWYV